jgi:hypothetical protein
MAIDRAGVEPLPRVMPAKAGIHPRRANGTAQAMDPSFRWGDGNFERVDSM